MCLPFPIEQQKLQADPVTDKNGKWANSTDAALYKLPAPRLRTAVVASLRAPAVSKNPRVVREKSWLFVSSANRVLDAWT